MTVVIALMASFDFWLTVDHSIAQYRKCGHVHVDFTLGTLALVLTGAVIWNLFRLWKIRKDRIRSSLIAGIEGGKTRERQ